MGGLGFELRFLFIQSLCALSCILLDLEECTEQQCLLKEAKHHGEARERLRTWCQRAQCKHVKEVDISL